MIISKSNLLRFVLLFIVSTLLSRGALPAQASGILSVSSTEPATMTVCGASAAVTVRVINQTGVTVTGIRLTADLPPGMKYVLASISGAAVYDVSDVNEPEFSLADLPPFDTAEISFTQLAGCGMIPFIQLGGIATSTFTVDYTGGFDVGGSPSINILYGVLTAAVSPNPVTKNVGATFTRTITVVNSGNGIVYGFTLRDLHGAGIDVTAISAGTLHPNDSMVFNSTDLGGGLSPGGTFSFTETVYVLACTGTSSEMRLSWGCGGEECQEFIEYASVVVPSNSPILKFTSVGSDSRCYGDGNEHVQQLVIKNDGPGTAKNVDLHIFQGHSEISSPIKNFFSRFDSSSFTLTGGPYSGSHIAPYYADTTAHHGILSCLGANAIGQVKLLIPQIDSGQTMTIQWNVFTCCLADCRPNTDMLGWRYQGTYENQCLGALSNIDNLVGRNLSFNRANLSAEGTTDLAPGDTGVYRFTIDQLSLLPNAATGVATLEASYTLTPGLNYISSQFVDPDGEVFLPSGPPVFSGGTVTVPYKYKHKPATFELPKSEFIVKAGANCAADPDGGAQSISYKLFYTPDTTCTSSCTLQVLCGTLPTTTHCLSSCSGGMQFNRFEVKRTNYGLADDAPEDGLPDAVNSLDFSRIRTNRLMVGDTMEAVFTGKVKVNPGNPAFLYGYASSTITESGILISLGWDVFIHDASSGLDYFCTRPAITAVSGKFSYDFSPPALAGCGGLPPGFIFEDGDSVVVKTRYKLNVNPSTADIVSRNFTNSFFLSHIPNPATDTQKFFCGNWGGAYTRVGYFYSTGGLSPLSTEGCGNITIQSPFYMSIGACCTNYDGGNAFPGEYRNWGHFKSQSFTLPAGYKYVSATMTTYHTKGYNNRHTSSLPIAPVSPTASPLVFNIEPYYAPWGGSIPLSDDGFRGILFLKIAPSCEVLPDKMQPIGRSSEFGKPAILSSSITSATSSDTNIKVLYRAPDLVITPLLATKPGITSTVTWDVKIENLSTGSGSTNTWIAAVSPGGGITPISAVLLPAMTPIPLSGGIFKLGNLGISASDRSKTIRITANYSVCDPDSLILYAGWNCTGYPASLAAAVCTTATSALYLNPAPALLQTLVNTPANPVDLCTPMDFEIEMNSASLASLYALMAKVQLPPGSGLQYMPGSAQLEYPIGTTTVVTDPTISGGKLTWNVSALHPLLTAGGLPGVGTESNANKRRLKLRFKLTSNCDVVSKSNILFSMDAESSCGAEFHTASSFAPQISGVIINYNASLGATVGDLSYCGDFASPVSVNFTHLSGAPTGSSDYIYVLLPSGVEYEPGSFAGGVNPPVSAVPVITTVGSFTRLAWQLPSGISPGSNSSFVFGVRGIHPGVCGDLSLEFQSVKVNSVICAATGDVCDIPGIIASTVEPAAVVAPVHTLTASSYACGNLSCNGSTDGTLTITPVGSTCMPSAAAWTGPGGFTASGFTLSGLSAGTYTAYIQYAPGCNPDTLSYTLTAPAPLLATVSSPETACGYHLTGAGSCDGSITTTVTGGCAPYTFLWSGPGGFISTSQNPAGLCAGAYSVITTDGNGCAATSMITLTEPPAILTAITGTASSCSVSCDGTADLTLSGGCPPYTFLWESGETTEDAFALCGGMANVTITDAVGFSVTDSVFIGGGVAVSASISCCADTFVHKGDSVAIWVSFEGTGPWSFTWSDGSFTYTETTGSNPHSIITTPDSTITISLLSVSSLGGSCPGTVCGRATIGVNHCNDGASSGSTDSSAKVAICHFPPGNPSKAHSICVGASAVPAHLAHGDHLGECLPGEGTPLPPGGCSGSGGSGDDSDSTDCESKCADLCIHTGMIASADSATCHTVTLEMSCDDSCFGGGKGKVAVCHIPPGNPAKAHTIYVATPAIPAHLAHGDVLGTCSDAGLGTSGTGTGTGTDGKKIMICHYPPGNPANAHTIVISENAWKAHEKHGDDMGPCAGDAAQRTFADISVPCGTVTSFSNSLGLEMEAITAAEESGITGIRLWDIPQCDGAIAPWTLTYTVCDDSTSCADYSCTPLVAYGTNDCVQYEEATMGSAGSGSGSVVSAPSMSMQAHPNPTRDAVTLQIWCIEGSKPYAGSAFRLSLMDGFGKVLIESDFVLDPFCFYATEIDLSTFTKGIYFVKVTNGTSQLVQKVVKM